MKENIKIHTNIKEIFKVKYLKYFVNVFLWNISVLFLPLILYLVVGQKYVYFVENQNLI